MLHYIWLVFLFFIVITSNIYVNGYTLFPFWRNLKRLEYSGKLVTVHQKALTENHETPSFESVSDQNTDANGTDYGKKLEVPVLRQLINYFYALDDIRLSSGQSRKDFVDREKIISIVDQVSLEACSEVSADEIMELLQFFITYHLFSCSSTSLKQFSERMIHSVVMHYDLYGLNQVQILLKKIIAAGYSWKSADFRVRRQLHFIFSRLIQQTPDSTFHQFSQLFFMFADLEWPWREMPKHFREALKLRMIRSMVETTSLKSTDVAVLMEATGRLKIHQSHDFSSIKSTYLYLNDLLLNDSYNGYKFRQKKRNGIVISQVNGCSTTVVLKVIHFSKDTKYCRSLWAIRTNLAGSYSFTTSTYLESYRRRLG